MFKKLWNLLYKGEQHVVGCTCHEGGRGSRSTRSEENANVRDVGHDILIRRTQAEQVAQSPQVATSRRLDFSCMYVNILGDTIFPDLFSATTFLHLTKCYSTDNHVVATTN